MIQRELYMSRVRFQRETAFWRTCHLPCRSIRRIYHLPLLFCGILTTLPPDASDIQTFLKYLTAGGMPYLSCLRFGEEPSEQYLEGLYHSVVLKDIVKRNNVRDFLMMEEWY